MSKITVIGGGTGSFTILSGLMKFQEFELTAIVPSTDSGGSTGRLRDEFGYLPMGDVRQCLIAMVPDEAEQLILRKLFMHRFDKKSETLNGHNFGNLFLTALTEVLEGDQIGAIKMAQRILNVRGNVYPVTMEDCQLVAEYENGEIIEGESKIDEPEYPHDGRLKISKLYTNPSAKTYENVIESIMNSDFIIIGPGDLYTSLIANLAVEGVSEALQKTKAKIIYIVNLVTKFAQTYNFTAKNHVEEIEKYLGKKVDYIFLNNAELPEDILQKYRLQNDYPVVNDLNGDSRLILTDLLANEFIKSAQGDVLKRSLIRHDGVKVAEAVNRLRNLS